MLKFSKMWLSNGLSWYVGSHSPRTSEDKAGTGKELSHFPYLEEERRGGAVMGQPSMASRCPSSVEVVVFAWPRGGCRSAKFAFGQFLSMNLFRFFFCRR